MEKMTKRERVEAALNFQEVDRLPISIWYHLPHVDQDPVNLAEETIALTRKYDYDFIKMMPFGNYGAQDYGLSVKFHCTPDKPAKERRFGIEDYSDWTKLEPLPAYYGTYGKQVEFAQQMKKQLKGEDIPYIQTIFSPLSIAKKLAGPRIYTDIKECPKQLHQALEAITQTTINFVNANIEAGVAGFFFASQCASYNLMSGEEYDEFGIAYDQRVMEAACNGTYFNMIHIHGENTMWERLEKLPGNALNWHDRWIGPTLAEARQMTKKCLCGGINEKIFMNETVDTIRDHIAEDVSMAGKVGYMVTPGCVAKLDTPQINFYAARTAVENV